MKAALSSYPFPVSVAPMMDYTDRHLRYLLRLLSKRILLYTEMITCEAILRGKRDLLLEYHATEHPLALQLGGSDPQKLAECAYIAEKFGYDEINLNAGCPSNRVQQGKFGACLMKEPELVRDCLLATKENVKIPVTLKTRIGVDELDSYKDLVNFMSCIAHSGCHTIILHARKAWLHGLSPKENRTIPPLCYEFVYQLKKDFPHLTIILNGGITTIADIEQALEQVDGVMIGRQVCANPYFLVEIDKLFYKGLQAPATRLEIVAQMIPYIKAETARGTRLNTISRHLLNVFHGTKNAKQWRRYLSEHIHKPEADVTVIVKAIDMMREITAS